METLNMTFCIQKCVFLNDNKEIDIHNYFIILNLNRNKLSPRLTHKAQSTSF